MPSSVARDNLARGLAGEIAEFKVRLSEARLRSQALEAAGRPEAAVDAVDEQRELLAELEQRMGAVLAAAAVEREAETVLARALAADDGPVRDRRLPRVVAVAGGALAAAVALLLALSGTGVPELMVATELAAEGDLPAHGASLAPASDTLGSDETSPRPARERDHGRASLGASSVASGNRGGPTFALPRLLTELLGLPATIAGEGLGALDDLIEVTGRAGALVRDGWEAAAELRTRAASTTDAAADPGASTSGVEVHPEGHEAHASEHEASDTSADEPRTGTREGAPPADGTSTDDGSADEPRSGDQDANEQDASEPGTPPVPEPDPSENPVGSDLGGGDSGVGAVGSDETE